MSSNLIKGTRQNNFYLTIEGGYLEITDLIVLQYLKYKAPREEKLCGKFIKVSFFFCHLRTSIFSKHLNKSFAKFLEVLILIQRLGAFRSLTCIVTSKFTLPHFHLLSNLKVLLTRFQYFMLQLGNYSELWHVIFSHFISSVNT